MFRKQKVPYTRFLTGLCLRSCCYPWASYFWRALVSSPAACLVFYIIMGKRHKIRAGCMCLKSGWLLNLFQ
uniref:Uncharacterized protein n=1 Tax=Anguilla anguilla TaxID=7936 RepID=A0A0E9WJV6_ANGAN